MGFNRLFVDGIHLKIVHMEGQIFKQLQYNHIIIVG